MKKKHRMAAGKMTAVLLVNYLAVNILMAVLVAGCGNTGEADPAQNGEVKADIKESMIVDVPEWEPIEPAKDEAGIEAAGQDSMTENSDDEGKSQEKSAGESGLVSLFGNASTMNNDVNGRELPIYCVDTEENKVALSFDAGWGNEDTPKLLEILKNHNLHVTFFMTGEWVSNYPDDVKAILAEGHDLGNHSENHKNMSQLSDEEKKEELMKVHEKVKELTGYEMYLFRPPYGDYDNAVIDVAKECKYYTIQWDVDSLDWQNKGVDSVINTVMEHKNLGNGSIILCHNGAEFTAQALDTLITRLQEAGYEIVPVSELIYKEDFHLNFAGRQIKNEDAGASGDGDYFSEESPHAKVTFFDVGKGDAVLIEAGEHTMLIDSGYDDTAETILDYLKEQDIDNLDYLLITHFDKDHVGGADWILKEVETGAVLAPDYESDSKQYQEYEETVEKEGLTPVLVTETMELSLEGVDFLIYPPQKKNYEEEDNDFSLVTSMTCGEVRFLFAGDCEKERLKELMSQREFALSHDILKVPHHGRKEKNSEEFIKAVSPRAAVITSSEEKPADGEVCRILENVGAKIYFTKDGAVTCLCNGKEIQMIQE